MKMSEEQFQAFLEYVEAVAYREAHRLVRGSASDRPVDEAEDHLRRLLVDANLG